MDFEKYTERSRGFVQSAQSLALREGHQQFSTEHLLKVLLDDPEGLAAGLIDRAGGDSRAALAAVEAALARPLASDPRLAERFELYCCGVELANGFGELTDATLQRRRLEAQMDERERIYGSRYPIDDSFIAALAHMPAASGCALGFDRIVMLATGAERIDQVLWTPLGDD